MIQKEITDILQKNGPSIYGSAFVTVTDVYITPDLLVARVYLSVLQSKDRDELLKQFSFHNKEIRHQLGNRLRHQLRKIPELEFFLDDSLDQVFKIEQIFKDIHSKDEGRDDVEETD